MMLTVLPSDTTAIRILALLWPVYALLTWLSNTHWNPPPWTLEPRPEPLKSLLVAFRFAALALSLWAAIPKSAKLPALVRQAVLPGRIALRVLWASIRLEILIGAIEYLYDSLPFLDLPFNLPAYVGWPMIWPPALRMAFAVLINEYVRRFIVGLFGGCGTRANDSSAAAVVQTMVSGDAVEALRSAHARLYTIKMSSLEPKDMANNQDSGLFSKTQKAAPSDCDAFLSHSWRDDADSKWQRMLEFRAEFEAKNDGREPQCWLDKACIDQAGDINAALRALPVFLMCSKYFVVFAGKTYTRRMWCVVELFTFVRSNGNLDSIVLKPLDQSDAEDAIATFDIGKADCYLREDKQRMRAIVESCYGSYQTFNTAVRSILHAKMSGTDASGTRGVKRGGAKKYQVGPRVAPEPEA